MPRIHESHSPAKTRWLSILTTLAPTLVGATALAQPAPAAPAASPPPTVPSDAQPSAAAPTPALEPAPVAATEPQPTPAPEATSAAETTAAPTVAVAAVPPPPPPPPPPPDAEAEKYKKINLSLWLRIAGVLQNPVNRSRMDRLSSNAEVEFHLNNQMRKWLQWTANFVGTYGGGSVDGAGNVAILDLIAQLEPSDYFNFWAGRMLVASDRSNFSGPYFMAPWNYPGAFGVGPRQGPFGRNDGATVWGQLAGGMLKYYVGAYNLYGETRPSGAYTAPLFSGRLNLSLLNPEPGYYSSSTYYGKDIFAVGVGGQYQKNGSPGAVGAAAADYSLFNADLLFEKELGGSGVIDVEGAFYKYMGDNEVNDFSYFGLVSYLTPSIENVGKFQPLVRIQQTKPKEIAGVTPDTATAVDAQVGYVIDGYSTRLALGFQHAKNSIGNIGNQVFLGIQLMK